MVNDFRYYTVHTFGARIDHIFCDLKRHGNIKCLLSLFVRQIYITRTCGNAVIVPLSWSDYDLSGYVQVDHHFANYRALLCILLTKDCDIRMGDIKKFQADCSHPP